MRTVLVISASRFYRESLVRLFQTDTGLRVLGAVEVSELLRQHVFQLQPEIVVLHPGPDHSDFAAVRTIHEAAPEAKVLVVEMKEDRGAFLRAVRAGARGFSLRDASPVQVRAAAHKLGRDGLVCPLPLILALFQAFADGLDSDSVLLGALSGLTPRELQMANLLAEGMENKEIAARLNLSLGTVKTHVHNILHKAGAKHRSELKQMVGSQ